VFDVLAAPILSQAGGTIAVHESTAAAVSATVTSSGRPVATLAAAGWNADLRRLRHATACRRSLQRPVWPC